MASVTPLPLPQPSNSVPIGRHATGALSIDLDRLLAGRLLIQGSSGAGKSRTLRRIIEEAFDYVLTIIVDPEGEFGNLATHIGATSLRACELTADGLTAASARARAHRIPLHLDLTDLDPDQRIVKAAAFFAGLIGAPREHWSHTVLVCIDEGHLLAPHHAGSARDAETRRLGVATLTDLCARGRKRGIAPVIATQRLAKLSSSVISELQNFLVGLNVCDRDIARAADLVGLSARLTAAAAIDSDEAERLLDLSALREVSSGGRDTTLTLKGTRALDAFLLDPSAPHAASIIGALKRIAPNATTADDLAGHLGCPREAIDNALDMLAAIAAVDTMPRGEDRIARLHARLRAKISDIPVVALA